MNKKTVILGASTNTARYSYLAAQMLTEYGHEIVPVGIKKGKVANKEILNINEQPDIQDVNTVTLYLGMDNQQPYWDYIESLNPRRVIFNPGAENEHLFKHLSTKGIEVENACTLVLLRSGLY